jgi:hypothetical protein
MKKEHSQLEKRVGDLQHKNMRVPMIVHHKDPFHSASHSKVLIVVLQTLQARRHAWVFLWLRFLRAINVVSTCNLAQNVP